MSEDKYHGNFWFGFFIGGLVGGFIIFLLGTREGKKLLTKLEEKGELFEEDLERKATDTQASVINKMDQTLSKIEDIQKQGAALTSEIRHKYFKKNGKTLAS